MVEMNPGKFDNIFNLLSLHDFAMNRNVTDDLKCNKCSRILVNACQTPCGCQYCRNCIDQMLNNSDFCPGNTEFCKDELLSNFNIDYKCNKKILKIVVKCPEELCPHECELINMEGHLRLCSNKLVKCPFYGLGCVDDKLVADKMGEHLHSEGYTHNKILIDLIGDMKNEVNELKRKVEKQNGEIERSNDQIDVLKEHARQKDKTIAEMNREIQNLTENARIKDKTIAKMQDEIKSIKEEKQKKEAEINNFKMESKMKMANLREEMTKELRDELGKEERRMKDVTEKGQLQPTSRVDAVEKRQDSSIEAPFSWRVDKISDQRKNCTNISSEIFYPKTSSYKMQLLMLNDAGSEDLWIRLYIYPSQNYASLEWPFQRNVAIRISNQAHPNASKSVTKQCQIPKPKKNSYKCSDAFKFSFSELSREGLMENDHFVIECLLE